MNMALYTWLYRNDKSWLVEHSPKPTRVIATKSLVDWGEWDKETYCVQTEVTRILTSDGKPERITISRIGKRIGCLPWSVGKAFGQDAAYKIVFGHGEGNRVKLSDSANQMGNAGD